MVCLGVTEPPSMIYRATARHDIGKVVANGKAEAAEYLDTQEDGVDVQELIYSKVSEVLAEDGDVAGTSLQLPDVRAMPTSPPPVSQGDDTLQGSWRPTPANWGPAYQPLTQVFSEISKLKSEQDTLRRQRQHQHSTPIHAQVPNTPTTLPLTPVFPPPSSPSTSTFMPRFSPPETPNGYGNHKAKKKSSNSNNSESELEIKI